MDPAEQTTDAAIPYAKMVVAMGRMGELVPLSSLVLVTLNVLTRAFSIYFCWEWMAVPLGAPSMNPAHAFGLFVLSSFFTRNHEQIRGIALRGTAERRALGLVDTMTALICVGVCFGLKFLI